MKQHYAYLTLFLFCFNFSFSQLNLQWQNMGPDNFGASVTGLIIDTRDATRQTLYAATMGAGVWKTTNGGNWWVQLSCMENMQGSCIAQASNGTIYVGTGPNYGATGSSLTLGAKGNGIYRIDAGDQISHVASTVAPINSMWEFVNGIAVNPQNPAHIIATTHKGIYTTGDTGNSWTQITAQGLSNGQMAHSLQWSVDGQRIFAAVSNRAKILRSINGGTNWELLTDSTHPGLPKTQGRIDIALSPTHTNVVYASIVTGFGSYYGLYKSTNGGDTWDTVARKNSTFNPSGSSAEGWFANAITVMPNDPDRILVGGVYMYSHSPATGMSQITPFTAHYNPSANDVHQFQYVVNDQNPDEIYIATVEGVFKATNTNSSFNNINVHWKSTGMRGSGFYSVAASKDGRVMGGNGEIGNLISDTESPNFTLLHSGYAFCEFSHLNPSVLFVEEFFGGLRRSANGGQSFDFVFDSNIDPQNHGEPSRCGGQLHQNAAFISPFILHETKTAYNSIDKVPYTATANYNAGDTVIVVSSTASTPFKYVLPTSVQAGQTIQVPDAVKSRLFLSSGCGVWIRTKALQYNTSPNTWFKLSSLNGIAYSFAATTNGNTLYVGTSGGRVYRLSGLNTILYTTINVDSTLQKQNVVVSSGRSIEGVAVDAHNDNHVICTIAGYSVSQQPNFYKSIDGGLTWTGIQVGPPSTPAYSCVIDQINSNRYIVGTESGIWTSDDAGATWYQESTPQCDVPVYRIRQIPLLTDDCPVLYAATQSMGIWRSFTLTPAGCNTSVGVNEVSGISGSLLKVYPNPSSGNNVYIEPGMEFVGGTMQMFDVTGKELLNQKIDAQKIGLNLQNFSKGMYIVTAIKDSVKLQTKLVID